jgi:hypothetical protein
VARLRKASVSRRADLAGDSRMGQPARINLRAPQAEHIGLLEGTRGTETSKYPEEKKSTEIPQVAASERGTAQTGGDLVVGRPMHRRGCRTRLRARHEPAGSYKIVI